MARKMSNTTQSRQSSFRKGNKTLKKSSFLKRKNKKTLNSKKKKNTQGNRKGRLSKRKRLIKEGGGEYWGQSRDRKNLALRDLHLSAAARAALVGQRDRADWGSENEPRGFTPLPPQLSEKYQLFVGGISEFDEFSPYIQFPSLKTNNIGRFGYPGTRNNFKIWRFKKSFNEDFYKKNGPADDLRILLVAKSENKPEIYSVAFVEDSYLDILESDKNIDDLKKELRDKELFDMDPDIWYAIREVTSFSRSG